MQEEYLRIRRRAVEDPGTAGDQGEENWAKLLRDCLPQYFHVVTKGRILTESGEASPQVDVVVLVPSYPKIWLDKKLYLSAGVAAAFECKLTLTAAHVRDAVKTCAALKRSLPKRDGSPYKELNAGLLYGLLAHSHSWNGPNSRPVENIDNALREADVEFVQHPRECIDCLTVSDLATWTACKTTFFGPSNRGWNEGMAKVHGPSGSASSAYICHAIGADWQQNPFFPIGALLSHLFSKLAWEFPDMGRLEWYFRKMISGTGKGEARLWDIGIYSEKIRERVYRGEQGVPSNEWWIGPY